VEEILSAIRRREDEVSVQGGMMCDPTVGVV